jgi:8-oxo-dGTP diphosphatase
MAEEQWPLKKEEFDEIYSKVPRLTVEVIVRDEHGAVYLTQRATGPCKGLWHLPGGTVQFGETLFHAVQRVALRELSIDVQRASNCGYIEYPSHYLKRRDCPVGLVFEVAAYSGNPMVNEEASGGAWFTKLPEHAHPDQDEFLVNNGYLAAKS